MTLYGTSNSVDEIIEITKLGENENWFQNNKYLRIENF